MTDLEKEPQTGEKTEQFYANALDENEKLDYQTAGRIEGIDNEIALLRVKIKTLLSGDSPDIRLAVAMAGTLAKLVKVRDSMTPKEQKGLKEAVGNVLRDVALPLGITVIRKDH